MYEHHTDHLLPRRQFILRLLRHLLLATLVILFSLAIGILGYFYLGGLSWLDSVLNASMILGGMGPVNPIDSDAGKWFAAFYALFAGVIFLVMAGILIAPVAHRFLHHLHLDEDRSEE